MTNQNSNTTSRNTTSNADKKNASNSNTSNVSNNTNTSQNTTDNMLDYVTGEYRSSSSHKFHSNNKDVSKDC